MYCEIIKIPLLSCILLVIATSNNIKMDIVDVKWWDMDCIDLAEDRVLLYVLVTQ